MGADKIPVKRFAWQAYEISSVAVPADANVGVGRSKEIDFSKLTDDEITKLPTEQKHRMKLLLDPKPTDGGANTVEIETKARTTALTDERKRVKEITASAELLAKDHPHAAEKIRSIVNESIAAETSVGDFQIRAMKEVLGAKKVVAVSMDELGVSEDEQKAYSVLRGIQSCLKNQSRVPTGLEGEVHSALVKRAGSNLSFEGFAVPL